MVAFGAACVLLFYQFGRSAALRQTPALAMGGRLSSCMALMSTRNKQDGHSIVTVSTSATKSLLWTTRRERILFLST